MWYNQRELYTSIPSNKLNNSEQFLLIDKINISPAGETKKTTAGLIKQCRK